MFFDETRVILQAGDGGRGCMSMHRAKFVPKGGPDGGDGGKGGDVVLEGDENVGDLRTFHFKPNWNAETGEAGKGAQRHGRNGVDCVLKVPLGTVVLAEESGELVTEITEHGQRVVLLKGGDGGLGNLHFKTATNQAPRRTTPGFPGEIGEFRLILKTIADVGLVGFPNAGKSTLLGALTDAEPKAAAYPFTTLHPVVGVMEDPERFDRIVLADIPGLIEGAHENRGLGHRFLRHIERCRVLLILIDAAAVDQRDPVDDLKTLLNELKCYDSRLLDKPRIVAANKAALPEAAEHLPRLRKAGKDPVIPLSPLEGEGLDTLRALLFERVRAIRAEDRRRKEAEAPEDDEGLE